MHVYTLLSVFALITEQSVSFCFKMADNEDDDWGNDWIDDDDGDKKHASKAAAAFEERKPVLPFVVLDSGQIAIHLRTLALEISDVLGVSVGDAGILLREYRYA